MIKLEMKGMKLEFDNYEDMARFIKDQEPSSSGVSKLVLPNMDSPSRGLTTNPDTIEKVCRNCGKKFLGHTASKYCSDECRAHVYKPKVILRKGAGNG